MQDLTDLARKFFAKDCFAVETTGIEIEHAGVKEAVCTLEITNKHMNAAGIVMGGALFTLADMASTVAANTELVAVGEEKRLWFSLGAQINFLRPGTYGKLTATAHCIKSGKTTCLYNVEITDKDNTLIATIQTTGIRTQ